MNSFHLHSFKLKTGCILTSSNTNSQYIQTHNGINGDSTYDIAEQLNSKDEYIKEQKDVTSSLKEFGLAYTAKLYANHQLPRNHVQNILDDSKDLV